MHSMQPKNATATSETNKYTVDVVESDVFEHFSYISYNKRPK